MNLSDSIEHDPNLTLSAAAPTVVRLSDSLNTTGTGAAMVRAGVAREETSRWQHGAIVKEMTRGAYTTLSKRLPTTTANRKIKPP
jgi:hypothetical protein